jgi:uncharacterized membrane protein YqjE
MEETQMTDEDAGLKEKEGSMSHSAERGEKTVSEFMTGLRLIVLLLILIAAVQLYFTIQGVIGMWVAYQFIPAVNAVYYLVVIIGGIWLLRDVLAKR